MTDEEQTAFTCLYNLLMMLAYQVSSCETAVCALCDKDPDPKLSEMYREFNRLAALHRKAAEANLDMMSKMLGGDDER